MSMVTTMHGPVERTESERLEQRVERLERRLESIEGHTTWCAHCEEGVVHVVGDVIHCDGCGYRCYL
jgi:hypothetical protein